MDLKKYIRVVPDFPKEGISFKDITTLLVDHEAFSYVIDQYYEKFKDKKIDVVVGIESRGFIFGTPLALKLGAAFVPARKQGKLPHETVEETYDLEYGSATVELHADSIREGQNVLIVDDLIATGGTLHATVNLVKKLGGTVISCAVLIDLTFLKGKEKIGAEVVSLIDY